MREVQTKGSRRSYDGRQSGRRSGRRRRRKGGCFGRLIFLCIIFGLVGFLGYRACQGLGVHTRIMQSRYPIKYQEYVETYAAEFGVDPALVYGVIRTESRFDPYAVSNAKAKGLMQLQDDTAADCARALKIRDYSADQLLDPALNIRPGCYYLKKLIAAYDQNLETAIAAYNGGPGNVDKGLKEQNYSKEAGKLARIPFPETARYVESVMAAYRNYHMLYY